METAILTAAASLLTSINTLVNTVLTKASDATVEAILQEHLAQKKKLDGVVDLIAQKLHLMPVPPSSTPANQ